MNVMCKPRHRQPLDRNDTVFGQLGGSSLGESDRPSSPQHHAPVSPGLFLDRAPDVSGRTLLAGLNRLAYGKFHAARIKTSWGSRFQRTVALVDGKDVVGSVEQYDLTGVLDGRVVRVCGIGSVHSEAAGSGRGYARQLVDMLLSSAARDGADMALLFPQTGIDDGVGEQFDAIHLTDLTLDVAQSPRHGAPMTMVRAGEERDLAAMVAMGRARATRIPLPPRSRHRLPSVRDHDKTTAGGSRAGECAPVAFLHRRRRHRRPQRM